MFYFHIDTQSYLPSQTPSAIKRLRGKELVILRGDGIGQRKKFERVYDYDVYNDIGDPDASDDTKRPVLGGNEFPYPRRCRTGGPRSEKDPLSESKSSFVYVPRDEAFSEVKSLTFSGNTLSSVLHAVVPALQSVAVDPDIHYLNQGVPLYMYQEMKHSQKSDCRDEQQQQFVEEDDGEPLEKKAATTAWAIATRTEGNVEPCISEAVASVTAGRRSFD
ncbi:linoleate 13S-lipoxygenase 2-1, chloroplastic-like [Nicotiana tabacum]|uniref:Linoleate 13S-lipoxygenase 2-1, chloroplastic-like n=1 Tax=Nicotiana tabacum TaxID=4097 RepID=A0AC58T5P1_TOBAC